MDIRTKTLAMVGTMVLALIGVLAAASYLLVTDRFARLEIKEIETQILRVHNGLNETIANLEATAADWAPWDNTYRFVQDLNQSYVEENLVDSTFTNLRLNFMLFFDTEANLVYSRFFELTPSHPLLDSYAVISEIRKYPALLKHTHAKSRVSGILPTGAVSFMITAQPIVTSKFELPIRGTLIFGRALDQQEIQRIGAVTQSDLAVHGITNPILKVPAAGVLAALAQPGNVFTKPISDDLIAGYDTICDLSNRPALIIEILRDRQVYLDGLATWRLNAVTMFGSGLFFLALMMLLLDRSVLNRIGDLARNVNDLAGSTDGTRRLAIRNFDEIGQLAQSINTMLESLNHFHSMQIASEKNYRAVVEDQTELICRTDEHGCLTFVNGAFGRFFKKNSDDLIGSNISEPMPSFWMQAIGDSGDGKEALDIRYNLRMPDGKNRCLQWHIRLIRSESPETSGYQIVGQDITEQILAQAALQENERYLRELLDSINCGVMVVDIRERCIVDINAAGATLLKRERQDIVGRICHHFVCPDEIGDCPVIDHERSIESSERTLVQADGNRLPILKSVTRTERGGHPYLIESFFDISHLLKIEADLRQSEERYRRFFEEDITGDFLASLDGRIIECNHSFAMMFGYESAEEIRAVPSKQLYPPSRNFYNLLLKRLLKERRLESIEFELKHKSGRPIYCVGNLVGHFDEKGTLKEIGGYLFDDTKRVLLEKNLRQAQKMEAIGTLAGGIAHDFNNILSGIMGYTEIALSELPATSQAAGRLQRVIKAANRAKELVYQILTFSRQGESDGRIIQLGPIIKEVVNLLRAGMPATIEIRQRIQSHSAIVADPVQIHQVIMNLCTNAGHAMKKLGGVLSISVEEVVLDDAFTNQYIGVNPGPFARIGIEDTGEGISPEIVDRIFDPFFTTKGKAEGTGLGLSVVHGIVSKLRGAITVTSSSRGSRFDVYLPCIKAIGEVMPIRSHPIPRGTERIVLIDDEDFQVDIGTQMLKTLGYHITGFTDSVEAFNYIKSHLDKTDLVITDMTMPKLTGIGLTRKLLELIPGLPIILCTGYSEEINAENALSMGVKGFIMKPIIVKDLVSKIREVLDSPNTKLTERPQEPRRLIP